MGSVRLASTASSHSITFDRAFAPFGEMYNTVIGGTSNPAFATLTRDTISDEYDTPNRELHPNQGRWVSPDPAGLSAADPGDPQSWNRYAYALNNPLSYTDPTGLYCYYGDTSEDSSDWGDSSQYDLHSTKRECSQNGGVWFDNPSTTITVYGNTNEVDTLSTFTGNHELIPDVTVQRSFDRLFPCKQTASKTIKNLQGKFPANANWKWGPLHVTFLQRGPLSPGALIPIDGPIGAWASVEGSSVGLVHAATSAVTVASVSSHSFTFATVPGMHPFDNGTVTFSASDAANGNINFGVGVNAAFATAFSQVAFNYLGGKALEASIWHNLINNVQGGCH
jgi:RHS repeat-associated protein